MEVKSRLVIYMIWSYIKSIIVMVPVLLLDTFIEKERETHTNITRVCINVLHGTRLTIRSTTIR